MFSLFMGSSQMNALEDAYNTLSKIKDSKDNKVHKKNEFDDVKKREKTVNNKRNKGRKVDKLMIILNKNKNKKPLKKFHLSVVVNRTITYVDKKNR